jgi:hypothetical protein
MWHVVAILVCALIVMPGFSPCAAPPANGTVSPAQLLPYSPSDALARSGVRILFVGESGRTRTIEINVADILRCETASFLMLSRTDITRHRLNSAEQSDVPDVSLADAVGQGWDAIWLDADPDVLPEPERNAIRDAVRGGTGLVYVGTEDDIAAWRTGRADNDNILKGIVLARVTPSVLGSCGTGLLITIPPIPVDAGKREGGDYAMASSAAIMAATGAYGTVITRIDLPRKIEIEAMDMMQYRVYLQHDGPDTTMRVKCLYRDSRNQIIAQSVDAYEINSGRSYLWIDMPQLYREHFSVDVVLEGDDGVAAISCASLPVTSMTGIGTVILWSRSIFGGDVFGGNVQVTGDFQEDMRISASLVAPDGTAFAREQLDIKKTNRFSSFTFLIPRVRTPRLDINIMYTKSNQFVQHHIEPLYLNELSAPGLFRIVVGDSGNSGFPLIMRAAAIGSLPRYSGAGLRVTDETQLDALSTAAKELTGSGAALFPMLSCGNGPKPIAALVSRADSLARLGVPGCVLSVGTRDLTTGMVPSDDYRTVRDAFLSVRPDGAVGPDGSLLGGIVRSGSDPADWRGDVSLVMASLTGETPITDPGLFPPILRLYGHRDASSYLVLDETVASEPNSIRAAPWQALFDGMDGVWWSHGWSGTDAAFTPALEVSPLVAPLRDEMLNIADGIDLLINGSERVHDPVAILYEPSSHSDSGRFAAFQGYYRCLRDAGYDPVIGTAGDIRELLDTDASQVRVLLLAGVDVGSSETMSLVRAVVEHGGTVIADGFLDHDAGLDDLFGIVRKQGDADGSSMHDVAAVSGSELLPDNWKLAGTGLAFGIDAGTDTEVYARGDDIPAVFGRNTGNGRAITVLLSFPEYETYRRHGAGAAFRELLTVLLATADVPPPVQLGRDGDDSVRHMDITRFTDGGARYVGLVADPVSKLSGGTGDVLLLDENGPWHIYNTSTSGFLGIGAGGGIDMKSGDARLLSLLPYRVRRIEISAERQVTTAGRRLRYTVRIVPDDTTTEPVRHVVRVTVTGPDGRERVWQRVVLETVDGGVEGTFYVGKDAQPGGWTLRAEDIASGRTAERTIGVMAAPQTMGVTVSPPAE